MHRTLQTGRKIGPIATASIVAILAYITLEGVAEAITWGALGVFHVPDMILYSILGIVLLAGIWPAAVLFKDTMKAEQALQAACDGAGIGR